MLRITVEEFQYAGESKGSYREEVQKRQVVEMIGDPKDSTKILAAVGTIVALIGNGTKEP